MSEAPRGDLGSSAGEPENAASPIPTGSQAGAETVPSAAVNPETPGGPETASPTNTVSDGSNPNIDIWHFTQIGDAEKVRQCLQNGADVEARDRKGAGLTLPFLHMILDILKSVRRLRELGKQARMWVPFLDIIQEILKDDAGVMAGGGEGTGMELPVIRTTRRLLEYGTQAGTMLPFETILEGIQKLSIRDEIEFFNNMIQKFLNHLNEAGILGEYPTTTLEGYLKDGANVETELLKNLMVTLFREILGNRVTNSASFCVNEESVPTLLLLASSVGHRGVVETLLENGAKRDAIDSRGQTAFFQAINWGHEEVVQVLLEKGEQCDARDSTGQPALSIAIDRGHEAVVGVLLDKGAKHNDMNYRGLTALCQAIITGNENIVRKLLAKGSDPNLKLKTGLAPLDLALHNRERSIEKLRGLEFDSLEAFALEAPERHANIIQMLLDSQCDVNAKRPLSGTALHKVAINGDEEIARKLIRHNCDIDATDYDGWTPLHHASRNCHLGIIQILLDAGSNVNAPTNSGDTPLHFLVTSSNEMEIEDEVNRPAGKDEHPEDEIEETVKKLLAKGADANAQNEDGETPVLVAAYWGVSNIIRVLFKRGGSLELRNRREWTPLLGAVQGEEAEAVKVLLELGSDFEVRGHHGWTPFYHAATIMVHVEITTLLLDKGCKTGDKFEGKTILNKLVETCSYDMSVDTSFYDVSKTILEKRPSAVNEPNDDGSTPLITACRLKNKDMILLILEHGENPEPESRDASGRTALHYAGEQGNGKLVKTLLENNLDPKVRDYNGKRAWDLALEYALSLQKKGEIGAQMSEAKASVQQLERGITFLDKHIFIQEQDEADVEFYSGHLGFTKEYGRLAWLAAKEERHSEFVHILSAKDKPQGFQSPSSLVLAAFHRYPMLVWTLLKVKKDRRDIKDAENVAAQAESRISAGQTQKIQEEKRSQTRYLKDTEQPIRAFEQEKLDNSLVLDLLRDPPPVKGVSDTSQFYQPKKKVEGGEKFNVTIVDFYSSEGRVDFLRRSRSAPEVIYGDSIGGPEKIMSQALLYLNEVYPDRRYEKDRLLMRWIHLPATNMTWSEDITLRVYLDNEKTQEEYFRTRNFLQRSWRESTGGPEFKFMKPSCTAGPKFEVQSKFENVQPQLELVEDKRPSDKQKSDPNPKTELSKDSLGKLDRNLALYMPYITFSKVCLSGEENRDDNPAESEASKRYRGLMEDFKGEIHGTRSLDRFYYPSVKNIEMYDRDQVLGRAFQSSIKGDEPGNSENAGNEKLDELPMLTVDQLWLWVIDEKTIVTCTTHRKDESEDPTIERILNQLRKEQENTTNARPAPSTIGELVRYITLTCIDFTNTTTWENSTLSIKGICDKHSLFKKSALETYADTIIKKNDQEKDFFESFRKKMKQRLDKCQKGVFSGKKSSEQAEMSGKKSLAQAETTDEYKDWESISNAAGFLQEIKDIRNELTILKVLVSQQKAVWDTMLSYCSGKSSLHGPDIIIHGPDAIMHELEEMSTLTDTIHEAMMGILTLEQSAIGITESLQAQTQTESSIEQTASSVKQGRVLMVFTVVTTFFAPLSFLTSLFALNIESFQHDHQGTLRYQDGWILPRIFGISLPLTFIVIAFAIWGVSVPSWFTEKKKRDTSADDSKNDQSNVKCTESGAESDPNQRKDADRENPPKTDPGTGSNSSDLQTVLSPNNNATAENGYGTDLSTGALRLDSAHNWFIRKFAEWKNRLLSRRKVEQTEA